MAKSSALILRVFTHPACSGCSSVVQAAWQLHEANPEVALRTVSLENKAGLDEAHSEGITTIPTAILSRAGAELARWIGGVTPAALATAVAEVTR